MKNLILNSFYLLFILFFFSGCKTYYDYNKVYFKEKDLIIENSEKLNFQIPINIYFNGSIKDNKKTYKVNGIIKIRDYNNFQILLSSKTLGIQIAQLEFFGDSLIFKNKIQKTSFKSSISKISYLRGLQLDSNKILRIITGRGFSNINYSPMSDSDLFNYNYYSLSGLAEFTNFGFLKIHNINIGSSKIEMSYGNFYKKYELPTYINGNIFSNSSNFVFNFKYSSITPLKSDYVHLTIPYNN